MRENIVLHIYIDTIPVGRRNILRKVYTQDGRHSIRWRNCRIPVHRGLHWMGHVYIVTQVNEYDSNVGPVKIREQVIDAPSWRE